MPYVRRGPEAGPPEEIVNGLCKRLEGRHEDRSAYDEDKVPPGRDARIGETNRLTGAALRVISVVRFTELFACHETTACSSNTVSCGIQDEQGVCPGFYIAPHTPELLRATEALVTPH